MAQPKIQQTNKQTKINDQSQKRYLDFTKVMDEILWINAKKIFACMNKASLNLSAI